MPYCADSDDVTEECVDNDFKTYVTIILIIYSCILVTIIIFVCCLYTAISTHDYKRIICFLIIHSVFWVLGIVGWCILFDNNWVWYLILVVNVSIIVVLIYIWTYAKVVKRLNRNGLKLE